MSAPPTQEPAEDAPPTPAGDGGLAGKLVRRVLIALAASLALLIAAGVGVRYGVRTSAGRGMVERMLDGLPLGPVGRLHVAGLSGDLFDAFGLREIAIIDPRGPWLVARDVAVVWDPAELLARRVHLSHLNAARVTVLRPPQMAKTPPQPPSKLPVSLLFDEMKLTLETQPAFSVQRGLWSVAAAGDIRRSGAVRARLSALSRLHAGDGASLLLRIGRRDRFLLRAEAAEAGGGALAGALGLPADRTLRVHAVGGGDALGGRLDLETRSGPATPLSAAVNWSKAGATVKGRVSLTASTRTRFLADRLGEAAEVDLFARQTPDGLYAIQGGVAATKGSLRLQGPVDWARRRTAGLSIDLAVSDLSRWLALPKIGPAEARGVLAGSAGDFTFKGAFEGRGLDQFGYTLAKAAGPLAVALKTGEWRLTTTLQGAGGGGRGAPAALLGAAPRAAVDLSVLKSGHLLFRTLNIAGSGVKVAAAGEQGLFGRLSFKGSADILALSALRPGARGGLTARWDASEGAGGKAWSFDFDGRGAGFSSGLADLDHFLGAAPRLAAKGAYGGEGLRIDDAHLTGAALEAKGKGALDPHAAVNADFDWSAKGPILAGPLEIAGAAKGTGKITGALSSLRADLNAELAALDLGALRVTPAKLTLALLTGADGVTGALAVSGPTARYGPASAKAAFRFAAGGLQLSDLVADAGGVKLSGALALRDAEPSSADLALIAGPGAFLDAGRAAGTVKLVDQPGGADAALSLTGEGMAFPGSPLRFKKVNLQAKGPLRQLPFQLAVDGVSPFSWTFAGGGVLNHATGQNQVTLQGGGTLRKSPFKLAAPAVLRFAGPDMSADVRLAIAGGQASLNAQAAKGGLDAAVKLDRIGLEAFSEDFTGAASGAFTLHGRGPHLEGALVAALSGARSRDAPANEGLNLAVKGNLAGARLHLDGTATNAAGLKSALALDLPAEASAAPFRIAIDRTRPVQGQFSIDGEVRPLWDLAAGGERTLSGHLAAAGAVNGSLNALLATGQGTLTGGKFRDVTTGLSLQNLQVDTSFGDNAVTVRRFSGSDPRGGTVSGDGRVSLAADGASTFTLDLKRFQLIDNDIGRATASGAVTVTHPAKGEGKLTGQLTIDRADIVAATPNPTGVVPMEVVEINQPLRAGGVAAPPRTLGPPILIDVGVKAPRGLYVKGKGLNVELSLDAHVGGTVAAPDLTGVARVVTGAYDFAGKRFDVDSSGVVRLGSTPSQIRLDLSARWEDPTLTAVVRVRGTAAKPEIALTSVPVLPQDEVLARVLFGVSAAQLSPAQGAELASALASLTGGGGFDVIGNLRQFAGLDRLALGGTQATGTTISGGKYINKDVYLELTGGGRTGTGAQVEWRIRHNLSLVSRYGASLDPRYANNPDASLSIRFRKDF